MARTKDVLTTGDVARICNVAPRTVSKWFDSGRLPGYRIPGSKDRRIPIDQLIRFMKAHDMPLDGIETGLTRILIAEQDAELAKALRMVLDRPGLYDTVCVRSAFEAGAQAEAHPPGVMLIDISMPGFAAADAVRAMRNVQQMQLCRLIAMTPADHRDAPESLRQRGFNAVLAKPFDGQQLIDAVASALQAEHTADTRTA